MVKPKNLNCFPDATLLQGQVEEVEFIAALDSSGVRLLLEVDVFTGFGKQEDGPQGTLPRERPIG